MKHIYDIEALMHKTGVTDYKELQSLGYDVIFYLKEKQQILQSKVDDLEEEINEIEEAIMDEYQESLNKKKTKKLISKLLSVSNYTATTAMMDLVLIWDSMRQESEILIMCISELKG